MQSQPGAQEGDFMKMSQGEQGNVDVQYGVDSGDQGKKKSSMVGKVKNKAKKISHKIKGATKKKKDEHGNDVEGDNVEGDTSSSSSEDEREPSEQQQAGYQGAAPTPEVRHDGVVHGGADKSRDLDLDREKEQGGGLSGGTQAYDDPSAPAPGSNWPRTDEELRSTTNPAQDEVPAAPGQESSGVSPIIASSGGQPEDTEVRSRDPDSSLAAGALAGKSEEKIPEDITKSEEEPKPVVDGIDSSGRDLVSSEVVDDKQKEVAPGDPSDKQLKSSDSQKGWMQTVKNVFMGSPKSTTTESTAAPVEGTGQDQKTWTEKARDAAVSAKDTAASKLPSSTGPKEDMPVSEQGADTKPSITSRAMESATAAKDTVASKLGYDQSGAQSTETPAVTEADPSKPASQGGITQKVMGVKDAVASKLGYGAGAGTEGEVGAKPVEGEKNSKLFTPDDDDTALSQKITDMLTLGGSKNTPANTPTLEASAGQESGKGGGVMDKVTGVMGSFLGKKQPDQDKPAATTPSEPDAPVKDTVMSDATA